MAKPGARMQKSFNGFFVWLFRKRKGRLAFRGAPTLILHTVGRKTGEPRETPLLYLDLGDGRLAVVGSNGGDDRTPAWVLNLAAKPAVEAELRGGTRVPYSAGIADAAERAELWPRLVEMYKSYASYQTKTDREIPVIVLAPITA